MTKCGKFLCLLVQLRLKSTKLTLKSTTTLTTKDNGSFNSFLKKLSKVVLRCRQ